MRTVSANAEVVRRLRESGLSGRMRSLESCRFLVIEEDGGRMVGACGVGGLFNVASLQIAEGCRGRGMGKKILREAVAEAGRRGCSFITGSRDPENAAAIRLHDLFGFRPVFRVRYARGMTRDVIVLVLRPRGRLAAAFLGLFDSLAGTAALAVALKIAKPLFRRALTLQPGDFPDQSVSSMIGGFSKLGPGAR